MTNDSANYIINLLSEAENRKLQSCSTTVHYRKGDIIFMQKTPASHVMFIKSGLVKIYREGRMNKSVILKLALPGSFIGLLSVFGNDVHQYSASAIEPCDIQIIEVSCFSEIIASNPVVAKKIIELISIKGLELFDRLMAQTHKQLPGRIADVLLYFSDKIYKCHRFSFPLTRRELAELAGTTKESFIRTLTEFKNDKIIELDGSEVEIKSMNLVRTLSELG